MAVFEVLPETSNYDNKWIDSVATAGFLPKVAKIVENSRDQISKKLTGLTKA